MNELHVVARCRSALADLFLLSGQYGQEEVMTSLQGPPSGAEWSVLKSAAR